MYTEFAIVAYQNGLYAIPNMKYNHWMSFVNDDTQDDDPDLEATTLFPKYAVKVYGYIKITEAYINGVHISDIVNKAVC